MIITISKINENTNKFQQHLESLESNVLKLSQQLQQFINLQTTTTTKETLSIIDKPLKSLRSRASTTEKVSPDQHTLRTVQ